MLFCLKQTIEVTAIIDVESREEAENLSYHIAATFEDEDGNPVEMNGRPLVDFEASSDASMPDVFRCDEDGNPIDDDEEEDPIPGLKVFLITSFQDFMDIREVQGSKPFTTNFREADILHGIPAQTQEGHVLICHCLAYQETRLAFYAPDEAVARMIRNYIETRLYDPHADAQYAY